MGKFVGNKDVKTALIDIKVGKQKGQIYIREGGKVFYFRTWLQAEKKYVRQSLDTEDLDAAKEAAQDILIDVASKVKTGQRVISITLGDLKQRYYLSLPQGMTAPRTQKLNIWRIERGMKFLATKKISLQTRLSSINGEVFGDYEQFRRKQTAEKNRTAKTKIALRNDVIRDELLGIRKLFKWGKEQKYLTDHTIPYWRIVVEREGPKRHRFTIDDWKTFVQVLRAWVGEDADKKERYHRHLFQHVAMTMGTAGFRTGEIAGLKNKDVQWPRQLPWLDKTKRPPISKGAGQCLVTIRAETSKVRKSRQVVVHVAPDGAGVYSPVNYLLRWRGFQRHKEPNDYVFASFDNDTGKDSRDIIYHMSKSFRARLREVNLGWFDLTHGRHFYATTQLQKNHSIHMIANVMGSSTRELEKTYSHVITAQASKKMDETQLRYGDDGSYEIVKRRKLKPR